MDSHLYGRVAHPDLAQTYLPVSILQLDEADRAVLRVADVRDGTQKKTFTKWVNNQLIKKACKIRDLFNDLRSGTALITLLEILSKQSLPRERGCMRFHYLQNVETALNFLTSRRGIRLVNIRPEDIVDGNPKLTLGLLWVIILHYQV
uniref:Calponin-homology (CH) domain-containing protein n=1 Tax=Macrostomum lignano TaxID=282301 RepID=A0A1I8GIW8_9PLAT